MWFRHFAMAVLLSGLVSSVQAAASFDVEQRGLMFSKWSETIARGDRVVFHNMDPVIHNIHVMTPGGDIEKNLGLQKGDVTLSHVFNKAGDYVVRCNIHPQMKMQVSVR